MIIGSLIGMALLLVYAPFALLLDYLDHFWKLEPRDAEITRAAHGIGLALLIPFVVHLADQGLWWGYLPALVWPYLKYRWFVVYGVIAIGVYWFIMGVARSRGYRDMRYITRALVKIAIGCFLLYANTNRLFMDLPWRRETFLLVAIAGYWCVITGCVKLALYMRGPPSRPTPGSGGQMPYGSAGFAQGLDE
jgi:hypothetical protein